MKIGIIGCGSMGSGIAQRLSETYTLALYDKDIKYAKELAETLHAKACANEAEVVACSDIIILAVKPQHLSTVANHIGKHLKNKQLLISILAGTPMSILKRYFSQIPILRVMPNLAAIYGQGAICIAENNAITPKMRKNAEALCANLGVVYWIPEDKMDAVTALSGSGPAFASAIIESMVDAAVLMGLDSAQSKALILQMLVGTVAILQETNQHPAELRWRVASPAGTTIAGIKAFEEGSVRSGIINTFLASYHRAKQISSEHS